jgi:carboxyl-terminal processing protease
VNKKISLSLTISLMALTAAVTFILTLSFSRTQFNNKVREVDRLSEKYQRLEELDRVVAQEYYTDIPEDQVMDGLLSGYVSGLGDRYSTYRSAEEYSEYQDSNQGVYTGIGITVQRVPDEPANILSVGENSAAAVAGINAGDRLVAVNGVSVASHYEEAISQIDGEIGDLITVTVLRADTGLERDFQVRLAQIEEKTVSYEMLAHRIGYIQITKFRSVTVQQFEEAIHALTSKGAEGIIFDVRDNGGGVLSALEAMVDPLLPEGELAFSCNKAGESETIIRSDNTSLELPYAVLVNGNSASAAELFACLMRDYGGAVLVGEKTFGKGIMQTSFNLSSGGVTLTTATYATGKTPCYHGVGLEPDILSVPDAESEEDTQLNDALNALTADQSAADGAA